MACCAASLSDCGGWCVAIRCLPGASIRFHCANLKVGRVDETHEHGFRRARSASTGACAHYYSVYRLLVRRDGLEAVLLRDQDAGRAAGYPAADCTRRPGDEGDFSRAVRRDYS